MILSEQFITSMDSLYKLYEIHKKNPSSKTHTHLLEAVNSLDEIMSEEILSSTQSRSERRALGVILADLECAFTPAEKTSFSKVKEIYRFLKDNNQFGIVETIECYTMFLSRTLKLTNRRSPSGVEEVDAVGAAETQPGASKRDRNALEAGQGALSSRFFPPQKARALREPAPDDYDSDPCAGAPCF